MAHEHIVYDENTHFTIDPMTRAISNGSDTITLGQHDHNSERFTFELPRVNEGHDMSHCNLVEVHFLNIESATRETNAGIYKVEDLHVSEEDENVVVCSWLISNNATMYEGVLNFTVRFKCVAEDGSVEYAWSSAIYTDISVAAGIANSDVIVEEFPDIIAQWEAELEAMDKKIGNGGLPEVGAADNGKVLTVSNGKWLAQTPEVPEIPTELPEVTNADKGKVLTVNEEGEWEAQTIEIPEMPEIPKELPDVTATDAGKILAVGSDGKWVATIPVVPEELPAVTTADNEKFLQVVNGEWAAVKIAIAEDGEF